MIDYLEQWLKMRVGAAPVWAAVNGATKSNQYTMTAVDSIGIVLSNASTGDVGVAFPWPSIVSVAPDKSR